MIIGFLFPESASILHFDLMWVSIILSGLPIIYGAVVGVVTRFDIRADVLVSIALVGAVLIGEPFAAAEIAVIMSIGTILEERTTRKAEEGIRRLMDLRPATARAVRDDGTEEMIAADKVQVGDVLRVLPGETAAADGVITRGKTSMDQSVLTGESLPVDKGEGDEVFSGTVNQFGAFDMMTTKAGQDSSLQRIIELVRSADVGKAPIVRAADRWATWIVVAALASAALTWAATGEAIRAVTVLVVFCPCALVLATPTAIMAGIGSAARFGILIRSGDALERLAKVRQVAFDKTGTLTSGKLEVVSVEAAPALAAEDIAVLSAAAERRSEHPLGKAILRHARSRGFPVAEPEEFEMVPGRGVRARVGGRAVAAGNLQFMAEMPAAVPEDLMKSASKHLDKGRAVVMVAVDGKVEGLIALSDTLRGDARRTVRRLHDLGIMTVLLTGDNARAASHMAERVGISEVRAGLLPRDKMEHIKSARGEGSICMVGDGVNDAAALKAANVGVAMGGIGSDISVDAADVVLMNDDIKRLPYLMDLSRRTLRKININIAAAMGLNFVAIVLAATGILDPVSGALVHNIGSVLVVMNSALLLRIKDRDEVARMFGEPPSPAPAA
ncbi:heavy metal translocating P-type ATPase [Methanomassiliicoccus luminyensis]|uniref:heavy metal translocating P-type ATPase n=1 Tax=Methanomassiliicoccus luminyensis TaxID=1080712 RepID=UPI000361A10E|nr:cation-translocating P-type ATPase [Methanomassiliicoccus luminyensis]